jgi:hypothetical protein
MLTLSTSRGRNAMAEQELARTSPGRHRRDVDALEAGALNIVTGADRDELEIEISPVGTDGPRTRGVVAARRVGPKIVYAALFTGVPAGQYIVWHDESTPAGTVVVSGGEVVEYQLV